MTHNENIIQIISNILAGDKDKFSAIVNLYKDSVFRIAIGYMHTKDEAEDIVQEVFIKSYQSLSSFKGKSEFSTWLYRITVNTCLNAINKKQRLNIFQKSEETAARIFNIRSEDKNPEESIVAGEKEKAVKEAINSLPKQQRTAFTLKRYEELSQSEISEIMEISEGAVEQLLQRARINLTNKLKNIR
ncbi:MAG: RNA polymerase sigma factor [Rikenellaceae bacterium]